MHQLRDGILLLDQVIGASVLLTIFSLAYLLMSWLLLNRLVMLYRGRCGDTRRCEKDEQAMDYGIRFLGRYGEWRTVPRPNTHRVTRHRRGDHLAHRLLSDD